MSRMLCWSLLLVIAAPAAARDSCEIRVVYDDYAPFSFTAQGTPSGFDVEVVRKVAAAMPCEAHFVERSWDDVLADIQAGRQQLAVGVGYHAERAQWAWYTEPYREERVALVVRRGEAARFVGASLMQVMASGLRFGRTAGDSDTPVVAAALGAHPAQVLAGVDEQANLKRLLARQIDGFLIERRVGAVLIEEAAAEERTEFHPLDMPPGRYRFMFSRHTAPELVLRFDAALQKLLAEDAFAALAVQYGVQ